MLFHFYNTCYFFICFYDGNDDKCYIYSVKNVSSTGFIMDSSLRIYCNYMYYCSTVIP